MSFFKKYSVTLDLANNIVKFPDITLQPKPEQGNYKVNMIELPTTQKTVIRPDEQLIVPLLAEKDLGTIQGTVEAFPAFESKTQLQLSPALAQVNEMSSRVQITNITSHTITLNPNTTVATLKVLTTNQAKHLQPMSNEQLTLMSKYPDEATNVLNQLFEEPDTKGDRRWYPTTCDDPSKLIPIERRIYNETIKFREEEKLDPSVDDHRCRTFLANFQWENSIVRLSSEHAAGYVLLIEDYTETNDGPMKTYAPVSFRSQLKARCP